MKDLLKDKIVFILLILTSIDFIYSRCCCGGNNGEGSRKASKPEDKIKVALGKYINTKSGNRVGLKTNWEVNSLNNGQYIITFGLFKVTIAKGEIGRVTNPKDIAQIENIECMMQMARDNETNFVFNNGGKCKLGDLMKSLNVLSVDCMNNDTDEYLNVKDLNEKFKISCYLNLNNGLMYKTSEDGMIGRASNTMTGGSFSGVRYPNYLKGEYYVKTGKWNKKDEDPNVEYNETIFESGDIKNFNFELETE